MRQDKKIEEFGKWMVRIEGASDLRYGNPIAAQHDTIARHRSS